MSVPSPGPEIYRWTHCALTQSRLQVEASLNEVNASSCAGAMYQISNCFHRIQGLLKMIRLDAASLLAHDLERLSGEIAGNGLAMDVDEAVVSLRNGLGTLQRYQSSIENQSALSPFFLMDAMNAIRQMTGQDSVSRRDLFDPALDFDPVCASGELPQLSGEDRRKLLTRLRKRYRKALLDRLNRPEQEESLAAMVQIMAQMQRVSPLQTYRQLWWVATGFMESLQGRSFDAVSGTIVLFARLDNAMSRITDCSDEVDRTPTNDLLRQMLYFIGSTDAGPDHSGRVGEIKTAFGLNQWFPGKAGYPEPDRFEQLSGAIVEFSKNFETDFFSGLESQLGRYLSGELDEEQTRALYADLDRMDRSSRETGLGPAGRLMGALRSVIQNVDTNPVHLVRTGGDKRMISSVSLLKAVVDDPYQVSARWLSSVAECESALGQLTVQDEKEGKEMCGRPRNRTDYSKVRAALLEDIAMLFAASGTHREDAHNLRQIEGHLNQMVWWFRDVREDQMAQLSENAARTLSCIRAQGMGLDREMKGKIAFVAAAIGIRSEPLESVRIRTGNLVEPAQKMLDSLTAGPDQLASDPDTPVSENEGVAEPARVSKDDFQKESEAVLTRLNARLVQWRTHGISAEILGNVRCEFQALQRSASVSGYDEIVRLGRAVEHLLEAGSGEASAASGSSLLNLMEEVHDGLASDLGLVPGATTGHVRTLTKIVELLSPGGVVHQEKAPDTELVNGETTSPDRHPPWMNRRGTDDILNYVEEFGWGRTRLETALDEARQELGNLRSITTSICDRLVDVEFDGDTPGESLPESGRQEEGPSDSGGNRHFTMQAGIQEMGQQLKRLVRTEHQLLDRVSDLEDILVRQSQLAEQLRKDIKNVWNAPVSE